MELNEGITVAELERRRLVGEKLEINLLPKKALTKKQKALMSKVMAWLGARGRGPAKIRGETEYYKKMVAIREAKKRTTDDC